MLKFQKKSHGSHQKHFIEIETLKNVKLPSKITTIEENTFYGCSELEAVVIPDQVIMIGKSAFDECTVLKSVTFGKSLKVIKRSGICFSKYQKLYNLIRNSKDRDRCFCWNQPDWDGYI